MTFGSIYNYIANSSNNRILVSIVIYVVAFYAINTFKPAFLYNSDGSLREFGLNSSRKTVIPVWLVALLIAILSYIAANAYIAHNVHSCVRLSGPGSHHEMACYPGNRLLRTQNLYKYHFKG